MVILLARDYPVVQGCLLFTASCMSSSTCWSIFVIHFDRV